ALRSLGDLELDLLVLLEALVTGPCDSAEVHEDVGTGTILGDEPEAFVSVEPLHCSCCHVNAFLVTPARRSASSYRRCSQRPPLTKWSPPSRVPLLVHAPSRAAAPRT